MAVVTPKFSVVRVVDKESPELGPKDTAERFEGRDRYEALYSLPWRSVPTTWQYSS